MSAEVPDATQVPVAAPDTDRSVSIERANVLALCPP